MMNKRVIFFFDYDITFLLNLHERMNVCNFSRLSQLTIWPPLLLTGELSRIGLSFLIRFPDQRACVRMFNHFARPRSKVLTQSDSSSILASPVNSSSKSSRSFNSCSWKLASWSFTAAELFGNFWMTLDPLFREANVKGFRPPKLTLRRLLFVINGLLDRWSKYQQMAQGSRWRK